MKRSETGAEGTGSAPSGQRASRTIVVAQVRELGDFLAVTSHLGGHKVVLIQPAERLHPSAANALLKTLEEPRARTVFMLVSDRPQQLLPTVRSRCFRIDFPVPERGEALDWLKANSVREPEIALAQAGFAPLAALELDQERVPGAAAYAQRSVGRSRRDGKRPRRNGECRRVAAALQPSLPLVL